MKIRTDSKSCYSLLLIEAAAQHAGLPHKLKVEPLNGKAPSPLVPFWDGIVYLELEGGQFFYDAPSAALFLLTQHGKEDLVGSSTAEKAAINSWIDWNRTPHVSSHQKIVKVEGALKSSKFLLGEKATLADLCIACALISSDFKTNSSVRVTSWIKSVLGSSFPLTAPSSSPSTPSTSTSTSAPPSITLSRNVPDVSNVPEPVFVKQNRFYISTAINYTNGSPHMGHAYEAILADVYARYHRAYGREVFFMTGTDEHGQKIAQSAQDKSLKPIELCNKYAEEFKSLDGRLDISFDRFVRTTEPNHYKLAQLIWTRSHDAGDIYLDTYTGWYNVREETFVTDTEAKKCVDANGAPVDPTTKKPLEHREEKSYFFRLSKYQQALIDHFSSPTSIQPDGRRHEILTRLQEPLKDLSVSRSTFSWGVPVPNDPAHVMYVWFDALSNYLSGIGYPDGANSRFWPCDCHLIGKDIVWFHTVIWQAMLMSAKVTLPLSVFCHGFVNDSQGQKMSKSIGNVVDPVAMLDRYPSDTFRYFLLQATPVGHDISFSEESLVTAHNSELLEIFGNLVNRAVHICHKYTGGVVPEVKKCHEPFAIKQLVQYTEDCYRVFAAQAGLLVAMDHARCLNKYFTDEAPWHSKDEVHRTIVTRTALEAIYVLAVFLQPYIPATTSEIFKRFNTKPAPISKLNTSFQNLKPGTPIVVGEVLFQKLEKPAAPIPQAQTVASLPATKGASPLPPASLTPEQIEKINAEITTQGDKVRKLKTEKADKDIIEAEVAILKALKAKLPAAPGEPADAKKKAGKKA